MTQLLSEGDVVRQLAKATVDRTVAAVVEDLDDMDGGMSGDDSGLDTVWEEICVQVQGQASVFWDTYDETVRGLIEDELPHLKEYEKTAIWFQTDEGHDWACSEPEDRDEYPFMDDEVVNHIAAAVYSFASNFERDSIRKYRESMLELD